MKLTYFANWKSCLRTLVLTMMVIVAVLAVKPTTVQAKASDYTQDIEGWIDACQKVGRDLTKYNFTYGSHNKPTLSASIKHGRKANCASCFMVSAGIRGAEEGTDLLHSWRKNP